MTARLLTGDCREVLRTLPDESAHCCVTSPPYFGLRDYGHAGQIGLEQTPDAYVAELVAVFREVRRVLRDDGTLWLNLGDSYASAGGSGFQGKNGQRADRRFTQESLRHHQNNGDLKSKDIIGIPWRVAFALQGFAVIPAASIAQWADWLRQAREDGDWQMVQMVEDRMRACVWLDALRADGWYLRQDIIWHKPNPMPESVTDRCTKAHEYIFLLTKSARYYYDAAAIAEESIHAGAVVMNDGGKNGQMGDFGATRGGFLKDGGVTVKDTRNKRSVWTVTTKPYSGAHFATFPPDLIEPCILAGCPVGGTVLDPFGGAGTTGLVADRLQRGAILIELNPAYVEMARGRISADSPLFAEAI